MKRFTAALCLSASFLALGIAGFALLQAASRAPDSQAAEVQELRETRLLLASLERRVTGLETKYRSLESKPSGTSAPTGSPEAPASGEAAGIQEQVEALNLRLAALEDEETIAQLAQSGEVQLVENELRTSLDQVGNPDASPEDRLEALQSIRRLGKTHGSLLKSAAGEGGFEERDLVLPMLELARDTTLEPDLRAEVVGSLAGTEIAEVRQPLLDLLAYDQVPDVRGEAVHALMWHLEDGTVREAITQASQADPDQGVRERAQDYLPKVQHFDRRATQAAGEAETGEGK